MNPLVTLKDFKRAHVIDQLAKYKFNDVEGMTYKELVSKLAMLRALEIKTESPEKSWF